MKSAAPASGGRPVEWSKCAIFGTVLALLGFATLWLVFGLFLSAIAAICGHVARHETATVPRRGRRLASFALWLGYATMLSFPVLVRVVGLTFPALEQWREGLEERHRAESRSRASRLFVACEEYARANRDRYPASWEDLSGRFLPGEELAELLRSPNRGGAKIAFELVRHDRPVLDAIADSVVVIQETAPPDIAEITVVHANGRVAALHNPDHEAP
jgi:hypothetical protein